MNGHKDSNGNYHYHATKTYPYLNGGFYGEVAERDGQVDPQPRARSVRPSLPGLRGVRITGYENPKPGSFIVRYEVLGDKRSVQYTVTEDGSAVFNFVSQQGTTTENYTPRQRGGGGENRRRSAEPPPGANRPPRGDQRGGDQADGNRGGPGHGRRVDPIAGALDANGDGQLDKTELQIAVKSLRTLDKNGDGQITIDELRSPVAGGGAAGGDRPQGNRPQGNGPPGQADGPRGPQPGDSPRQPWILVHADEIDLDKDRIISRDEIVGEATRAFAGYDANNDGKLSESELRGRGGSRSAMGGFLKGHSQEIDRDGDGIVTRIEAVDNAERMFAKMDQNGDGKITPEEMEASRRD